MRRQNHEGYAMSDADPARIARLGDGVSGIDAVHWNRCAGSGNPFLCHAFLSALEDSGSFQLTPKAIARANMSSIMAGPMPGIGRGAAIIPSCRSPCPSRQCLARGS
jgi:hypothetical protein